MSGKNPEGLMAALQAAQIAFLREEPLSRHTTFQIGGPAALYCQPATVPELARCLELCKANAVRSYLLGNGSNVLFSDAGFDGAVIATAGLHIGVAIDRRQDGGAILRAGAGEKLSAVCNAALAAGLTGLEFAYGIPGTIGGAVYMNAGAYGGEMKQVLGRVSYLDERAHLWHAAVDELAMGYRTSVFEKNAWCIVEAEFIMQPGAPAQIKAAMQDLMQRRKEKQPLDLPSAGSTFKRPQGAFAGSLIEQCGLRGFAVGGAAISTKHCGFVVNQGGATCADVVALTEQVSRMVKEKTGYTLEREIRVVE